jgi:dihydropteroate synthase
MGILNVTPDSFSDGGRFEDPQMAVAQGLRLVAEGADLLDIGGESTRPYSISVDADTEKARVLPVIQGLSREIGVPISIDTSKASVARAAIDAGAEIINDVTGLTGDPAMPQLALESGAGLCVMHMQGTPQTMQDAPAYRDVVGEVLHYLTQRRDHLIGLGIDPTRICVDPGIGFGKTFEHNRLLLQNVERFHCLGCPILIGHSRKGFLAKLLGDAQQDRRAASVGVALAMASFGVSVLRVHDVRATVDALRGFCALSPSWNPSHRLPTVI